MGNRQRPKKRPALEPFHLIDHPAQLPLKPGGLLDLD